MMSGGANNQSNNMGGAGGGSMANMSAVSSGIPNGTQGAARGGFDPSAEQMGSFQ